MSEPHRMRLRNGIRTVNGITGETEPTYGLYVLASDYDALAAERDALRQRVEFLLGVIDAREARLAEAEAERETLRKRLADLIVLLTVNPTAYASDVLDAWKPAGSAEAVTWKPIIILCRTCGADVNREPHKPGCSADITASQPTVVVECNCDDHDAKYCVNRISKTVRCGCECHR